MHNIFKDVSAIALLHSRFKLIYMLLLPDEQLQVFELCYTTFSGSTYFFILFHYVYCTL